MRTYIVKVQAYAPSPREYTEQVKANSFATAMNRAVRTVIKEKLAGKRPYKVSAFAERL